MSEPTGDATLRTRVVEGAGSLARLGELAAELGERVLLVTDASLVEAGHVGRAERALRDAGRTVHRFADVHADPTTDDVERCRAVAERFGPDLFVGLGGGSAIDAAKGANFVLCCGGSMEDYRGRGTATAPLLPMIAVPTTAGTGSEVQSFALIARADTHEKMACGDPAAAPRVALLDAELTITAPPFVTACTGLDAIAHAVETAVTRARTDVSRRLSHEAFALAASSFERVLEAPTDVDARARMLRAACLAGRAIENSMLGAAHALANPLSAHHGTPHGQAVGTMLPHVVRFNAGDPAVASEYAALARAGGLEADGADGAEALARTLERWLERAGVAHSLTALGVVDAELATLAREAAGQWTAGFNPREVDEGDLAELYRAARG